MLATRLSTRGQEEKPRRASGSQQAKAGRRAVLGIMVIFLASNLGHTSEAKRNCFKRCQVVSCKYMYMMHFQTRRRPACEQINLFSEMSQLMS